MNTFNPLGAFSVDAPLLDVALATARSFLAKLPKVPSGDLTRIYLHQSAEAYGCVDASYHAVVSLDGDKWAINYAHDVRDNARSTFDSNYAEATYCRNTGSCAIAVDGLIGSQVTPSNFGSEPLQMHELEHLCAGAAAFCVAYSIDSGGISLDSDPYYGEPNILTHAEAANLVGAPPAYTAYGPGFTWERWDLLTFVPIPQGVSFSDPSVCGNALRARIHLYAAALKGEHS